MRRDLGNYYVGGQKDGPGDKGRKGIAQRQEKGLDGLLFNLLNMMFNLMENRNGYTFLNVGNDRTGCL